MSRLRHTHHSLYRHALRPGFVLAALLAGVAAASLGGATGAAADACPTYNAPNTLTLVGGTPQSAKLGTAFSDPFQVALTNSNGCPITTPLAGIPVTFAAPGSGPSGTFASSGANAVLVGTNASGAATAPPFTADHLTGGYQLVASSDYGSVSFSLVNTASGVPATITAGTPSIQSATVGSRYSQPLEATVLDADGTPIDGATVTFTLGTGGGGAGAPTGSSTAGASFDGGASQATETTDAAGTATSPLFTANSTAGPFTATAATPGVVGPASFSLDNLAGRPPSISALAPFHQSTTTGASYGKPLQVRLLGANGKPMQGATVTFLLGSPSSGGAAAGGSASAGASFVDGSSQATETTDASGLATSPRFSANATAGRFTATATTTGTNDAASFSLDNLAAKSASISALAPVHQSTTTGASYGKPLQVKVRDGRGAVLEGATVTFTLGSATGGGGASAGGSAAAGASFVDGSSQATETTDAAGIATSPRFSANTTAGRFTATASTSGTTDVASFSLDNLAGKSPTITALGDGERTATVAARYAEPLQARVRDASGGPLQGVSVTFTLGSTGGGSGAAGSASAAAAFVGGGTQATEATDAAGIATSPRLIADTTAGSFSATATAAGSINAASFALHNLPGRPASLTAGVAASESTVLGTRFPVRLAVTVTDKNDNPVSGINVSFSAPSSGAAGDFDGTRRTVMVKTDAKGVAVAPPFVANGTPGGYVVRATASDHSAAFALVNQPAA
jgi:adhesin/invasin